MVGAKLALRGAAAGPGKVILRLAIQEHHYARPMTDNLLFSRNRLSFMTTRNPYPASQHNQGNGLPTSTELVQCVE
jgi:hypothetical protein